VFHTLDFGENQSVLISGLRGSGKTSMLTMLQAGANVMVVFAGIKVDLDALLEQSHTTFLRRSRPLDFRRLTPKETRYVLEESIRIGGRKIEEKALRELIAVSQGYPYLVQLVGDYAWRNDPRDDVIDEADAAIAHDKAITAVQRRVISRVYQDLSEKDREFVQAMAVDKGRSKISDIVKRMDVSPQYVQVYKRRLIDTGYVRTDGHGYVEFSLPYLGEYVRSMDADTAPSESATSDDWDAFPPPASV
jgi:hypothetical protein